VLTTAERLEYIARMGAGNLKASYKERVVPAAGEDVQRAAANLRADVEADYYAAVQLLKDRGALTSSEAAGLRPQINLTVLDQR
jgi:hypothetical protein